MAPEQLANILGISFYAFVVMAAIGIGLAIFFFFHYRIPVVYTLMTGRAQKRTIERMQRSGQLRSKEELEAEREASVRSLTGGLTGDFLTEALSKAQLVQDLRTMPGYADSSATTVLGSAEETTVLEPEVATTILAGEAETAVLDQGIPGDETEITTPLNQTMQNAQHETTEGSNPEVPSENAAAQYLFDSTEHTVVVHTDEMI